MKYENITIDKPYCNVGYTPSHKLDISTSKKVYCKDCKIHYDAKHKQKNVKLYRAGKCYTWQYNGREFNDPAYIDYNKDNNCRNYKKVWWKFWK